MTQSCQRRGTKQLFAPLYVPLELSCDLTQAQMFPVLHEAHCANNATIIAPEVLACWAFPWPKGGLILEILYFPPPFSHSLAFCSERGTLLCIWGHEGNVYMILPKHARSGEKVESVVL